MTIAMDNADPIRSYLLGVLDDGERERIEEKCFLDSEFFQELSVREETLLRDYLAGALTADERLALERRLEEAPALVARLRQTEALLAGLRRHSAAATTPSGFFAPSAAWVACAILIAAGAVLLVRVAFRRAPQPVTVAENAKPPASTISGPIPELRVRLEPSARRVPVSTSSEISLNPETRVIRFELRLRGLPRGEQYTAKIRVADTGASVWTGPVETPISDPSAGFVEFAVPVTALPRADDYTIELMKKGRSGPVTGYYFRLLPR